MEGHEYVERINRMSSIENEPRTLSINQIQRAREAALNVVNSRSREEAMDVFLKGLKPVACASRQLQDIMVGEIECLEDHLPLPIIRDAASAPV